MWEKKKFNYKKKWYVCGKKEAVLFIYLFIEKEEVVLVLGN